MAGEGPEGRTYDVVIVGAGIVGCSIAFHLASRGARNIALVDRGLPGNGSTSKATGGFRHQFATRINIELSLESSAVLRDFEHIVGSPLAIRQCGYLFLSDESPRIAAMQRNVDLQRSMGVQVDVLRRNELDGLVPGLILSDATVGTYCSADGLASPTDACAGFLAAARKLGVEVHPRHAVLAIETEGGRVSGLRTENGHIVCERIVLSAGVWSPAIAQTVGVGLPIRPHHRQAFMTVGDADVPASAPFTIDLDTGAYFHGEGEGLIIGGTDHGDERGFDDRLDWSILPTLVEALTRRMPAIENLDVQSGWAGLREMTPDEHGIVGRMPGVEGAFVGAGFSGHGFMHSPAVGRILAELVDTGSVSHPDISALAPTRFDSSEAGVRDANSF